MFSGRALASSRANQVSTTDDREQSEREVFGTRKHSWLLFPVRATKVGGSGLYAGRGALSQWLFT